MSDIPSQPGPALPSGPGHEPDDLKVGKVLLSVAALVVLAVAIHWVVSGLMGRFAVLQTRAEASRPALIGDVRGQYPAPRLQQDPAADMAKMRKADAEALAKYGWVDREAGIAQVPIDRAMELLVKKGLPTRDDKAKPRAQPKAR